MMRSERNQERVDPPPIKWRSVVRTVASCGLFSNVQIHKQLRMVMMVYRCGLLFEMALDRKHIHLFWSLLVGELLLVCSRGLIDRWSRDFAFILIMVTAREPHKFHSPPRSRRRTLERSLIVIRFCSSSSSSIAQCRGCGWKSVPILGWWKLNKICKLKDKQISGQWTGIFKCVLLTFCALPFETLFVRQTKWPTCADCDSFFCAKTHL